MLTCIAAPTLTPVKRQVFRTMNSVLGYVSGVDSVAFRIYQHITWSRGYIIKICYANRSLSGEV